MNLPELPTDKAKREALLNALSLLGFSNGKMARHYSVTPPTIANWRSPTKRQHNRDNVRQWKKLKSDKQKEQRRRERKQPRAVIAQRQRQRFRKFLKKERTTGRLADWIGCDWETLVAWLELWFKDGMTWENYGDWHIDHIRPLVSFDLTNSEQAAIAWHFSNLQPLWAEENIRKGSKLHFIPIFPDHVAT